MIKRNKTFGIIMLLGVLLLPGCATVDMGKTSDAIASDGGFDSDEEYLTARNREQTEAEQKELEKNQGLAAMGAQMQIIYIDRPVYLEGDGIMKDNTAKNQVEEKPKTLSGYEAVDASYQAANHVPMNFKNGVMIYPYDESFQYEIYCSTYRVTDIVLEPGEVVLEQPFISEHSIWEISGGVSKQNGFDVQHFFVKPSKSNLTTSMIIITDKHVYHLLLRSFNDRYMIQVKWNYPAPTFRNFIPGVKPSLENTNTNNTAAGSGLTVNPAFLSFDYTMSYSVFRKKPEWLPTRIYDDGARTYIQLDKSILHTESPVLFNNKNEKVNYRVSANLIIIDQLIQKVTVKLGKDSVTIEKKRQK